MYGITKPIGFWNCLYTGILELIITYTFILLSLHIEREREEMAEPTTNQNMADASKDAALPTPPATPVPLPKKFPKGVVLGKDGKP